MKCKKNFFCFMMILCSLFIFESAVIKADTDIYSDNLGMSYSASSTTFKIWADEAKNVSVVIDDTSTVKPLEKINGVWIGIVSGDLLGYEYSYKVEYDDITYENVLDPYGKCLNSSSTRNVICSDSQFQYSPWQEEKFNLKINDKNKIIYGLDVVNYTKDANSWNGSAENAGKLLGLIEASTKYNNISTGFDHIYNLGITYAELYRLYDVKNPFVVNPVISNNEHSYSSNLELKTVVDTYALKGIGISMAFDYKDLDISDLIKLDNQYASGSYLDLNNAIVQNYIMHVLEYWVREYNLSGLRIDNMQDYSLKYINELSNRLLDINENLMIYGDGSYINSKEGYATQDNLANINDVKMINGSLSYSLVGNLFNNIDRGLLSGSYDESAIESLKFAFLSSVNNEEINYELVKGISYKNYWNNKSSYDLINNLGSRNGLSIYDKLMMDNLGSENLIKQKIILGYMALMTSGGIPYIYSGDEFLASYMSETSSDNTICHPSANICFYSVEENKVINWNLAYSNSNTVDAFRSFSNFRKSNTNIQETRTSVLKTNLKFYEDENKMGIIGYELKMANAYNGDVEYVRCLFNFSNLGHVIENLGDNKWIGLYNNNKSNREGEKITMNSNDFYIEYKVKKAPLPSWLVLIIVIGVVGGLYSLVILANKKLVEEKGYDIKDINRKYRIFIDKKKINNQSSQTEKGNEENKQNTEENNENEKADNN